MILGKILFYTGLIFVAMGALCTIALLLEPVARAFGVVFKRRRDYVFYETKQGRQLVESSFSLIKSGIILLIVTGAILMAAGLWIEKTYGGESDKKGDERVTEASSGIQVMAEAEGYDHVISITGRSVYLDGDEIGTGADGLESIASGMGRGEQILLVDDFAGSKTYHQVRDTLNRYALNFTETQ